MLIFILIFSTIRGCYLHIYHINQLAVLISWERNLQYRVVQSRSGHTKDLILVLMNCKKPVYLKAGSFGFLSYSMILSVSLNYNQTEYVV
ncbi:hypothetical protein NQ314_015254 [Rhamnusium bicolor]|uniref:Uncharacterized protein n=1 Tax=Rhamnusium bicolor TaxID=1586634 RepID=A0AAV8WZG6_9CUCU|nr:hypothetical protein NQ314_015254 [Rhamnusium bicolor]